MREFARAILSEQEDGLTCSTCKAQLAEYVDAQIMGTEPVDGFAQIELHLQVCPHCAREYSELMALVTSAYTEEAPRPARKPRFDFSFLEAEPGKPFWWDRLGQLIIDFAMAFWQPPLHPTPAYAVKGEEEERKPDVEGEPRLPLRFSLGSPEVDDLQVDITVAADRHEPVSCTVAAKVEVPSRWPELEGMQVTLTVGQEAYSGVTDESGEVTFRTIPVGQLRTTKLKIRPS